MKLIHLFHKARVARGRAMHDRERLGRTMPGETGALAALRLGVFGG